jgi:murein L,D-transpeptidase YafK
MLSKLNATHFLVLSLLLLFFSVATSESYSHAFEKIPDSIVSISSGYVVAVDKKMQKLYVFKKGDGFARVFEAACSTGKNQGTKQVSGDAKTPTGIFFATKILTNPGPPETYGTLAFPLDYPTITDRKAGKNGTNIWIHGTTKPIMSFQTNGCVVLNDKDIQALAKFIQLNKTPVIIAESIRWVPQNQTTPVKNELEKVLSDWTKGYREGNIHALDRLYLKNFQITGKKRERLASSLSNIQSVKQHFVLEPRDISILRHDQDAVIVFDQISDINKDGSFSGFFQRLSLQNISHQWLILDDEAVTAPVVQKTVSPAAPSPDTESATRTAAQKLVTRWVKSWESGNMSAYRSCYAPNFRAQGMNLEQWVSHKASVRDRSKNIRIRIADVRISAAANQATAVFQQHYSSNLLKSSGTKKLEMRKTNGTWKINRESMQ